MTDLPDSWRQVPLGDTLSRITYGFTNPMPTVSSGPFMLTAKDIREGRIDYESARHTSDEAYATLITDKSRPRIGDILLTKDGSIGRVAVVDRPDVCINQSVALLQPTVDVDGRYLAYLLQAPAYQQRMASDADGSTIKHIYITRVDKMPIALPPIDEQRGIADVLGALDAKIESSQKVGKTLEELSRALFASWFINFDQWGGTPPDGWTHGRLGDVVRLVKQTTKAGQLPDLPYVPIDSIPMRSLGLAEALPNQLAQSSLITFAKDDILIGAMRVYFHRVAVAPFDGIARATCFVLRSTDPHYLEYALLLCNENSTIAWAEASSKGSTMPYAVWDNGLADLPTLIPTQEVAKKFSDLVRPIVVRLRDGMFELQQLRRLRDTLLPALMDGRIRVPEAREVMIEVVG